MTLAPRVRHLVEASLVINRELDPDVVIHTIVEVARDVVGARCAGLTVVDPGHVVQADPTYMDVVLSNLVNNALRHGGEHVSIAAWRDGSDVRLAVRDDGGGVPPAVVPRLFERFSRGTGSSGTGLGLALSRALVEHFGGRVWYEPDEGGEGGSAAFHVSLPAA